MTTTNKISNEKTENNKSAIKVAIERQEKYAAWIKGWMNTLGV